MAGGHTKPQQRGMVYTVPCGSCSRGRVRISRRDTVPHPDGGGRVTLGIVRVICGDCCRAGVK